MKEIKYRRDIWQLIEGVKGGAAEIGVAEGNFSEDMLRWPVNLPVVYMVDRWLSVPTQRGDGGFHQEWHDKNLAQVRARTAKYGPRAIILQGDSVEMAKSVPDSSLALVYIDGDHSFTGVTRDLTAWVPKVVPGGVVALHDYLAPQYGVRLAANRFCFDRYKVNLIPEDKPEDAGAWFYVNPI